MKHTLKLHKKKNSKFLKMVNDGKLDLKMRKKKKKVKYLKSNSLKVFIEQH